MAAFCQWRAEWTPGGEMDYVQQSKLRCRRVVETHWRHDTFEVFETLAQSLTEVQNEIGSNNTTPLQGVTTGDLQKCVVRET